MTKLLTVKQVAEMLSISPSMVYDLVSLSKIRCFRIAGRGRGTLRFAEEMVAEYLSSALQGIDATPLPSAPTSSGSWAAPFSELDPDRLRRAWKGD